MEQIINTKIFPFAVFACRVVVAIIWTMTMWVLSYWQFNPDDNHFSLHLYMHLDYRVHQVVDSTDLCACLNGALLNIESQSIKTPKIVWNHTNVTTLKIYIVSLNHEHHDCTILYPHYNLDFKH